jgi:hypothetical protein
MVDVYILTIFSLVILLPVAKHGHFTSAIKKRGIKMDRWKDRRAPPG